MNPDDPCLSALRDVVAEAYRVFRHREAPPFPLDVCLGCCVSREVEAQLRMRPLAQLTAQHFYEYNGSAKSEVQSAQEVGHLLPRMLELLAEGAEIHHSIEISLKRLGSCPQGSWREDEQRVLDRFALAYFEAVLRSAPWLTELHWRLSDPLSILLMFDIGGLAIAPLLDLWLACEDPAATVQFVEATYWDFWPQREYRNAFSDDRPAFRQQLREWLLNPAHQRRFVDKLLAPAFQDLAVLQPPTGHTAFSTMVDVVFDQLSAQGECE